MRRWCRVIGRLGLIGLVYITAFLSCTWMVLQITQSGDDIASSKAPVLSVGEDVFLPASMKQHRIVLCSKVMDETPYLIEWIEFHRMQGVDKFAFYPAYLPGDRINVATTLSMETLQSLYAERNMSNLIDLHPTLDLIPDLDAALRYSLNDTSTEVHRVQQHALLAHCTQKYSTKADWLLHMDVDEFLYADWGNQTLWDFLNGQRPPGAWLGQAFDPLRTLGYYILPTQMGGGGRVFDFHTRVVLDAAAGLTQIVFDPRDSSALFREQQSGDDCDVEAALRALLHEKNSVPDELLRSFLEEAVHEPRQKDAICNQRRFTAIAQALKEMEGSTQYSSHVSRTVEAAFLEVYPHNQVMDLLPPGPALSRLSDELNDMWNRAKLQKMIVEAHSNVPDALPNQMQATKREKLAREIRDAWMQYYPLIIDEQPFRAKTAGDAGPVGNFLRNQQTEKNRLADPVLSAFIGNATSPRSWPGWMTRSGKTIYRTASMTRSPENRKRGRLRSCLRPWVHSCTHEASAGIVRHLSQGEGLRLDHHQFRSLERRTTSLPRWRGGPVGYAAHPDFSGWAAYFSSHSEPRWNETASRLRRRIGDIFSPIPKFFNYTLIPPTANLGLQIHSSGIFTKCSPLELLDGVQMICPKSHPFVGLGATGHESPSPHLPYTWCTNTTEGRAVPLHESWATLTRQLNASRFRAISSFVTACPGWPETRCCDAQFTFNGPSLWESSIAVLVSENNVYWGGAV